MAAEQKRKTRPYHMMLQPGPDGRVFTVYIFNSNCAGCGFDTYPSEYVMLKPSVWERCKVADGCLCIGCIEKRLKRKLTSADFSTDECDRAVLKAYSQTGRLSERCLNRLGYNKDRNEVTYYGDPYSP